MPSYCIALPGVLAFPKLGEETAEFAVLRW